MKGTNITRKKVPSSKASGSDLWKLAAVLSVVLAVLWMIKGDPGAFLITLIAAGFAVVKGWAIGAGIPSAGYDMTDIGKIVEPGIEGELARRWYGHDDD